VLPANNHRKRGKRYIRHCGAEGFYKDYTPSSRWIVLIPANSFDFGQDLASEAEIAILTAYCDDFESVLPKSVGQSLIMVSRIHL
jgi:hypothetical protein